MLNVLPIAEVELANDPGRLLPFVMLTPNDEISNVVTFPSESVTVKVVFAPSSSVKK